MVFISGIISTVVAQLGSIMLKELDQSTRLVVGADGDVANLTATLKLILAVLVPCTETRNKRYVIRARDPGFLTGNTFHRSSSQSFGTGTGWAISRLWSFKIATNTRLMVRHTVSPDRWNNNWHVLFFMLWPIVTRNMASISSTSIFLVLVNPPSVLSNVTKFQKILRFIRSMFRQFTFVVVVVFKRNPLLYTSRP